MRFRAEIRDAHNLREFQNLMVAFAKLSKECVTRISRNKVFFILNEAAGCAAPLVWLEMDAATFFEKYKMEGVSDTSPHIMLSFQLQQLNRALTVIRKNARSSCKIKLTNSPFPCLTIEASETASDGAGQAMHAAHDIPVSVIAVTDWNMYTKPKAPDCRLEMVVPLKRLTRAIIDKMKNISPTIQFTATSLGLLKLLVETDVSTITTRYLDLAVCVRDDQDSGDGAGAGGCVERRFPSGFFGKRGPVVFSSCTVDSKKAAVFLSAVHAPSAQMTCGIADDRAIHLAVSVRTGVVVHSILPAVCV